MAAPSQPQKSFFKRGRARLLLQFTQRSAGQQAPSVKHSDAIGEKLDFRKRVRGEEQSCFAAAKNLEFKEAAKFGGADSVQTACRLVQQKYTRLMQESAAEAQTLQGARRKCSDLPVKSFPEMKLFRQLRDALLCSGTRDLVQASEKFEVLSQGESRVEARVAASVVAELATYRAGVQHCIVSGDLRAAVGRKNQGSENAEKCGFASAVRSQ